MKAELDSSQHAQYSQDESIYTQQDMVIWQYFLDIIVVTSHLIKTHNNTLPRRELKSEWSNLSKNFSKSFNITKECKQSSNDNLPSIRVKNDQTTANGQQNNTGLQKSSKTVIWVYSYAHQSYIQIQYNKDTYRNISVYQP